MAHNGAIERIALAVQCVANAVGLSTPPASPLAGEVHIVGDSPTGEWAGRDKALAMYGAGGWIFIEAFEGLSAYSVATGQVVRFENGSWEVAVHRGGVEDANGDLLLSSRQGAVPLPAGGTTQDNEARSAIEAIVDRLESHGLIEMN